MNPRIFVMSRSTAASLWRSSLRALATQRPERIVQVRACSSLPPARGRSDRSSKAVKARVLKESKASLTRRTKAEWLSSLQSPVLKAADVGDENADGSESDLGELMCVGTSLASPDKNADVVIGIDPDFKGAIAVLRTGRDQQLVAEVFDVPTIKVVIANKVRVRPDARSIVNLLHNLNVPKGTVAYIESSLPFPSDGKQGWWSTGFGFGLWIGTLMASGISVTPVAASVWKVAAGVALKDESRTKASLMFPSLAPLLKRKMDHGRAEALLIAAYGKGFFTPGTEAEANSESAATYPDEVRREKTIRIATASASNIGLRS